MSLSKSDSDYPKGPSAGLPRGIVSVVQTAFDHRGAVDYESLERLVEDAILGGVAGLLAPVVASEVAWLSETERKTVVRRIAATAAGRVPLVVGASSDRPDLCRSMAELAETVGASAYLVAVPEWLYDTPDRIIDFYREATRQVRLPLVIQDFHWKGPGLDIRTIERLQEALPMLAGMKIETLPAGPKYTAVRKALGPDFYIAGGWAVKQMIEALDRGVDAMIPESSMVRVYTAIYCTYAGGDRRQSQSIFHRLLPVLAFTNQDVPTSIAFFKRLLVRKRIFTSDTLRWTGLVEDHYHKRIAEELLEYYLQLEDDLVQPR